MKIVRVVQQSPSIMQRAVDGFDAMPVWAQAGAVALAPVAITAGVVVGAELAIAAVAGFATISVFGAVFGPQPDIQQEDIAIDQLEDWKDFEGNHLEIGQRYLNHPIQKNVFLRTDSYHHQIVREQQSHLISYIRSILPVRRLIIAITYDDLEGSSIEAAPSGFFGSNKRRDTGLILSDLTYNQPELVEPVTDLFWLGHFTNIREALRQSGTGKKIFKEKLARNLECHISVAKKFGFKKEALKSYTLEVSLEF